MKETEKKRRVKYQTAYMKRQKEIGNVRVCRMIPKEHVEAFDVALKRMEKKWEKL